MDASDSKGRGRSDSQRLRATAENHQRPEAKRPKRPSGKGRKYPWHSRRRRRGPAYGALDLGTNNCRLLVAVPSRDGFRVIDAFSRIVRLGEGLGKNGKLSKPAMARTLEALRICAAKLKRHGVRRSRLIATQACRGAGNSAEFLERVRRETGLVLEIVSQETEAHLAVAGCAALLDPASDHALVFDVGGGSSELMWLQLGKTGKKSSRKGNGNARSGVWPEHKIIAWTSLPLGVVTLAEKFGGVDVCPQVFESMIAYVTPLLHDFEEKHQLSRAIAEQNVHLLGTSGTVTTIAGIHLELERYDRNRVDGCWLSRDEGSAVSRRLLQMDYNARAASPCIGRDRADLVLAGCAILEAVMRKWPARRLRVADRGLREGILTRLMNEDGRLHRKPAS